MNVMKNKRRCKSNKHKMHELDKYIIAGAIAVAAEIAFYSAFPVPEPEDTYDVYYQSSAAEYEPTRQLSAEVVEIPINTVKTPHMATCDATEEVTDACYYDIPMDDSLQDYLIITAGDYGLDPELVFGVIWMESRYQVDAIGDDGMAIGLMQIQPRWHQDRMYKLCVTDLSDPQSNILVGCDILSELIGRYGVTGGLTYYRWGKHDADRAYADSVLWYTHTIERR